MAGKFKVQRAGSYVVKAAESPITRIPPKAGYVQPAASDTDRQLAKAVRKLKSSGANSQLRD